MPQWMGSVSGFAPVESMPDHVILTKYNALVYRALQQKQAKVQRYCRSGNFRHLSLAQMLKIEHNINLVCV